MEAERIFDTRYSRLALNTDAICEFRFILRENEGRPAGLFAGWLIASLTVMLFWIERIRRAAGVPDIEYGLAPQLLVRGDSAVLAPYGSQNFGTGFGEEDLPSGQHPFPIISVGNSSEFQTHLTRFDEDIWHLVGRSYSTQAQFDLSEALQSLAR